MFEKILIANRGEIACRIIRTCSRMGIATVAVYSEADADGLHVAMADEAVAIGPAPAGESYLRIERIVAAAKATGAQAVHPGYGFLAENPAFVEALEEAGIVFIGPTREAMAAMGDKLESKRVAKRAGVTTIPGHDGILRDADEAVEIARGLGFPVMLKASAGGGGKGMRIACDEEEAREGFRAAASEALASFGDDRVLIEKFIERPRHIEIQVLADAHGNVVHLNERECSIQRRHQKVIEEAPSPLVDPAMRAEMGAQAVALAHAVRYRSAGTVEFVVGPDKSFYFLEMNTRLQVEHPITEAITGLDLVAEMIRIAAGEPLAFTQADVPLDGWAIEARVYAEDPRRGFLPAPGRLVRYRPPPEGEGVRIDAGVYEGAEVTMFYDPMIAKLICSGEDRKTAIARMRAALDAFVLRGPGHNLDFLAAVVRHPRFVAGDLDTDFIEREYGGVFEGAALEGAVRDALLAAAVAVHLRTTERDNQISGRLPEARWRPPSRLVVALGPVRATVEAALTNPGVEIVEDGRARLVLSDWRPGAPLFAATIDGEAITVRVRRRGEGWLLAHGGAEVYALVRTERAAELAARMPEKVAADRSRYLLAPMPGRVVSVVVAAGDEVKAGQALAVIDAMKMENVLRAERDGRIARIDVAPGDSLGADQVILEFA